MGSLSTTRHDPSPNREPSGGPFLWSNSPETFAARSGGNTRPVLAKLTLNEACTVRVGCHHANKSGQNRRLCAVVVNPSATEALTVTVPRNVPHHQYIQEGSGLGFTVAIPGREVASAWFAGTNVAGHVTTPPPIAPGESLWIELGDLVAQGVRRVRSHIDQQGTLSFGVVGALLELNVGGPAVVYVVASEQDITPASLAEPTNAAERDTHQRGTVTGFRAVTTFDQPIVARVPRLPSSDDRYYLFRPDWLPITDELPDPKPSVPFKGEYFIEQRVRFKVNNFHHTPGNLHVIVNARGGVGCGAVRQLHSSPTVVSIADVCANFTDPNPGLLMSSSHGVELTQFSFNAGTPSGTLTNFEFDFMLGSGGTAPLTSSGRHAFRKSRHQTNPSNLEDKNDDFHFGLSGAFTSVPAAHL